jgi:hypothetical protein
MMVSGNKFRDQIFYKNRDRLCELASRAVFVHGKDPEKVAVVAVQVDDPFWGHLADALMPEADWGAIRAQGMEPLARGSVEWSTVEVICDVCPGVACVLERPSMAGTVYALVLADNGVAIYEVPYTGKVDA